MSELLGDSAGQFVLALAGLASLLAVGFYLIGKVRHDVKAKSASPHEHLANFREIHFEGGLSDEEYRTIKAMLAEPLKQELKADAEQD
jgi:hypothetical protein